MLLGLIERSRIYGRIAYIGKVDMILALDTLRFFIVHNTQKSEYTQVTIKSCHQIEFKCYGTIC